MITQGIIEEVKKRLVATYNPRKIYLFGSYAWGNPTEDSDLDILVVVDVLNDESAQRTKAGILALYGLGISKDLLVYTKNEFDERVLNKQSFIHKVSQHGKVIYERS